MIAEICLLTFFNPFAKTRWFKTAIYIFLSISHKHRHWISLLSHSILMQLKQHEIKSGMKSRFSQLCNCFSHFKSIFSTVVQPRVLNERLVVFSEISIDQVAVLQITLILFYQASWDRINTTGNCIFHFSNENNLWSQHWKRISLVVLKRVIVKETAKIKKKQSKQVA